MKLHVVMVTRNEAARYLESVLSALNPIVDSIFVYDDDSEDDTRDVASKAGATVASRPNWVPTFMEHEGEFRQAAWQEFETVMKPQVGDWVLAIDADEFLATNIGLPLRETVRDLAAKAAADKKVGVIIPIHEVFAVEDGQPMIRTDGFWATIAAPRLFAYHPMGAFADKPMGSGSAPTYVTARPVMAEKHKVALLHYGYVDPNDREAKWLRYTSLLSSGHNPAHVASIRTPAQFSTWQGSVPVIDRQS